MTNLVCFNPLREADLELERARLKYRVAAHALAKVRERLDQVLDLAYQQQSFAPLNTLFDKEEKVLVAYERAVRRLAEAEGRWCAVRAALAYEKELMRVGSLSRQWLN